MARAERLNAGDPFISAGNINKVIEQANRLSDFKGGPGINSQNDATGLNLSGRRSPVLDGDSPFDSSGDSPWRKTMQRSTGTTGTTRHKGEFELYNSSVVSQWATSISTDSSNLLPLSASGVAVYGVPFLYIGSSGNGQLGWGTMDGDSPFESSIGASGSHRKTMHRRSGSTTHKNDFELYNSSQVSAKGRAVSSSIPQYYGIPFLPVDSSGHGALLWGPMDADESGDAGPRSLERRSSSSGERFQVYAFDDAATTLDSSEVVQVAVRRRYGSSGNHYVAWVDSSDLDSSVATAFPRWNEILDATANTVFKSGSSGKSLSIGTTAVEWDTIKMLADKSISIQANRTGLGIPAFGLWLRSGNGAADPAIQIVDGIGLYVAGKDDPVEVTSDDYAILSGDGGSWFKADGGDAKIIATGSAALDITTTGGALKINGTKVIGTQGATIANTSGGATVDSEARATIGLIIDRMQAHGLIA